LSTPSDEKLKAAISLGSQMAQQEALMKLAQKTVQAQSTESPPTSLL
jgi:hypothetical protein